MRTLRVYTYNELDDAAKKRAVDSVRYKVGGIIADFDGEDYKKSLNTIENAFSIDVFNWEVGYRGHHSWRTDGIDLDIDEPRMLCRYLETVYYNVHQGKYIGWHKGKHKAYYSKVLSGEDSFSPNGEWTDDAIVCLMLKRYEYVRMG